MIFCNLAGNCAVLLWAVVCTLACVVMGQGDFPPSISNCFEPLCGVSFAYCSRVSNTTILPFRALPSTNKLCVHTSELVDFFCSDPYPDWAIMLPGCFLNNGTTIGIHEFDGVTWSQSRARYIIRDIETLPESFTTSWIRLNPSEYGSLSFGRMFIQFQANKVSLDRDGMMQMLIADGGKLDLPNYGSNLDSGEDNNVEPGSWFFDIYSMIHPDGSTDPLPSHLSPSSSIVRLKSEGYIEFVLTKEEILNHRRFAVHKPVMRSVGINTETTAGGGDTLLQPQNHVGGRMSNALDGILSSGRTSRQVRHSSSTAAITITTPAEDAFPAHATPERNVNNRGSEGNSQTPINICIWGSNKLDGQKSIWINQIEHMMSGSSSSSSSKNNNSNTGDDDSDSDGAHISFTWILTTNTSGPGSLKVLSKLPIPPKIINSPFENLPISLSDLNEVPDDGSPPFSERGEVTQELVTAYILERLHATPNGSFDHISPRWVNKFLLSARDRIGDLECGIMVYGSNRGFSTDALIVMMGRALNIPTVSELLNLFADPINLPDVIIGPSHYSVYHDSIAGLLEPDSGVRVEVIPPGIDLARFDINRFEIATGVGAVDNKLNSHRWRHPACPNNSNRKDCIVIGFMARLSVEKNPGLFVMAAWNLYSRNQSVRFIMIGDGALLHHIKDLVYIMGLSDIFYFPGWLTGSELPDTLSGIDMMLNPSLRAWSETFCIANIEAMAMGIPLVTFGVGGVGEYISPPGRCSSDDDIDTGGLSHTSFAKEWISYTCRSERGDSQHIAVPGFEVVANAVLLNDADPTIIGQALEYLIDNPAERVRIGKAGHDTVKTFFNTARQMKQYKRIYKEIYHRYYNYNQSSSAGGQL